MSVEIKSVEIKVSCTQVSCSTFFWTSYTFGVFLTSILLGNRRNTGKSSPAVFRQTLYSCMNALSNNSPPSRRSRNLRCMKVSIPRQLSTCLVSMVKSGPYTVAYRLLRLCKSDRQNPSLTAFRQGLVTKYTTPAGPLGILQADMSLDK